MAKKVLIVDNNPFFLETIKEALMPLGFDVESYTDPIKAWDCLQKRDFDYILIDHIMPQIDGSKLCKYLKEDPNKSKTPVIIMTGVAIEVANRVKEINADAYIAKSPIQNFVESIRSVIERFETKSDVNSLRNSIVGIEKIYPREMTKELIEIENHLSQILSTMKEGVIECNSDYKVFFVNKSAQDLLGITEREMLGKNLFKVLGMDSDISIKGMFPSSEAIKSNENISTQFCMNLGERTFSININSLNTGYTDRGILIVFEDVSELMQRINHLSIVNNFGKTLTAELELEEVIEKIVHEFNNLLPSDTLVFLQNKENTINEFFVKSVVGINNRLTPGNTISSNILLKLSEGVTFLYLKAHKDIHNYLKNIVSDLGYNPERALVLPIKFQKHYLGVILFLNQNKDFDERIFQMFEPLINFSSIALENALRYRRLKDLNIWRQNYMANISHELRTPLTIIKGFNEILCQKILKDEESKQVILNNMLNEVNKLVRLIDNLLTISKFENIPSFLKIRHAPVDIHSLIRKAIEELKKEAESKKITFIKAFHDRPIKVEGDEELLMQCFYHLISNAIKYSKTNGRVEVSTTISGNLVYIKIKDFGIGIKEEDLSKIFDKFYMIDAGPNRTTRGTGIGLYLVRELINLHYGNVQVESTYGKGTTFTIKLPLSSTEFLQ
ncbi:MAG: ATP-binding protein [Proteobacteria bacterium]|nr:ATP-binding protein [Pseudomonadota bacterium]